MPASQLTPAVRRMVDLMDTRYRIPGTRFRFGFDALLGLVPGVGDFLGMLIGYGLVLEAIRLRLPWSIVGRMLLNLGIDAALGAVPLVGDLFDFFFKAHRRNLELLERRLAA